MTAGPDTGAATIPPRMPEGEKPYRVYRGGRTKGRVPLEAEEPKRRDAGPRDGGARRGRSTRRRVARWMALMAGVLVLVAVTWAGLGFLSFRQGVDAANARLPKGASKQLSDPGGSLLSRARNTLVIGTDGGRAPGREGNNRSDSLMLVRTDPRTHTISYLSIPRDLRVEIPGYGSSKINAANQYGGPALTMATVRRLTGLPVDHLVVVDFDDFRELIDAIGGVDVKVPKPILSNKFDCPYKTAAECASWPGWKFAAGRQHMDGRRALVYSRIRKNQLDPSDTDISRTERQQAVAAAVADKLASFGTFVRAPFIGDSLAAPLTTDLGAWQFAQLGWIHLRSGGKELHCRLGGDPTTIGGESMLIGSEDNAAVISMFTGRTAPQPPPKGSLYGPGCPRR
jgi:polyisoprenyl-teichoic acid--peptidoglycan teichoic acid transferase